jgi:hypothetical protein
VSARAAQAPAELFAGSAYDPSAGGGLVAWQRPADRGRILRNGAYQGVPGSHPALGGGRIAWREGDAIVVAEAATLERRERHDAPGAGVLAISDALLAWRSHDPATGVDRIWLVATGAPPRLLLEVAAPDELGRPALFGSLLLCHVAGPAGSRLIAVDSATAAQAILRAEPGAQLSNPATDGTLLLYVHATGRAQELRVGPVAPLDPGEDAVVLVHPSSGRRDREREPGRRRHRHQGRRPRLPPRAQPGVVDTLWTTALTAEAAYVTRLRAVRGAPRSADILRVPIVP